MFSKWKCLSAIALLISAAGVWILTVPNNAAEYLPKLTPARGVRPLYAGLLNETFSFGASRTYLVDLDTESAYFAVKKDLAGRGYVERPPERMFGHHGRHFLGLGHLFTYSGVRHFIYVGIEPNFEGQTPRTRIFETANVPRYPPIVAP